MELLRRVEILGYKTLRDVRLDLRRLNVMIGANGAGKSNFVSFFRLLGFLSTEALQLYIGRSGGANGLLFYGAKRTPQIEIRLDFENDDGDNTYSAQLVHAAGDMLVFVDEELIFLRRGAVGPPRVLNLGAGHRESLMRWRSEQEHDPTAYVIRRLLRRCKAFQFHDTSDFAPIRQTAHSSDNLYLRSDAGNLAAYLRRLAAEDGHPDAYRRIVDTIRQVAPFFDDFVLEPDGGAESGILLRWRERGSEIVFGPHQLSDGTLRTMALVTLLLQPDESLPSLLVIDEPELGLHPYALTVVASLIRAASTRCQILISTQSTALLDHFDAEDVIVVERGEGGSTFSRLDPEDLADWLAEYSLSELWEKNVLGGRPGAWPA